MGKYLIFLFLIVFIFLSGCNSVSSLFTEKYPVYSTTVNGIEIYSYSPIPPPQSKWSYEVKTSSYWYYAQQCTQNSEGVTITNYWITEFENNKAYWVFKKDTKFMSKQAYGDVQVTRYR